MVREPYTKKGFNKSKSHVTVRALKMMKPYYDTERKEWVGKVNFYNPLTYIFVIGAIGYAFLLDVKESFEEMVDTLKDEYKAYREHNEERDFESDRYLSYKDAPKK